LPKLELILVIYLKNKLKLFKSFSSTDVLLISLLASRLQKLFVPNVNSTGIFLSFNFRIHIVQSQYGAIPVYIKRLIQLQSGLRIRIRKGFVDFSGSGSVIGFQIRILDPDQFFYLTKWWKQLKFKIYLYQTTIISSYSE